MTEVTVIGLGPMGSTLAELMLKAGKSVTVWNRSPDKANGLIERGAKRATDPADAISASPVILICVYDYDAVETILAANGVSGAIRGRLVINLGTGSPGDASRTEAFVHRHHGSYLDGAIQAAPSQMGQSDTPLLISGSRSQLVVAEALLKILAGNVVYLGEKIDAAASMDLSTLSYIYGSIAGFLHGARIAEAAGGDVAAYGGIVNAISPSFGAVFQHEGGVIASDDFRVTESPLRISIAAVRRIRQHSEQLGLNSELPALVDNWLMRADKSGFADEELAAVIKVLRQDSFQLPHLASQRSI